MENVSGKLSTIDVFQNRLFPRINGTEEEDEKCSIITNLKYQHFTTCYYNTYDGQARRRGYTLGRPKRLLFCLLQIFRLVRRPINTIIQLIQGEKKSRREQDHSHLMLR